MNGNIWNDLRKRIGALDGAVLFAIVTVGGLGLWFMAWLISGPTITVTKGPSGASIVSAVSPLTGRSCADPLRRPIAVMLASDPEARPLSGIGAADMVFEMPVTPNGITRMMAVFQCNEPEEVGSIRSARGDFLPLVEGLQALYAHWGGERDALKLLDEGITDNIDALAYEGTVYYRKAGVPRPHNGFTTLEALRKKAADLGYASSVSLDPYRRTTDQPERNLASLVTDLSIPWPQGMDVSFRYDPARNTYRRWRGGLPEVDRSTGQQVEASVVVVLETEATFRYDQYLSVRTVGQGTALVYQNGRRFSGLWNKPSADAMVSFVDARGEPIGLVPGTLWMLYDPPL